MKIDSKIRFLVSLKKFARPYANIVRSKNIHLAPALIALAPGKYLYKNMFKSKFQKKITIRVMNKNIGFLLCVFHNPHITITVVKKPIPVCVSELNLKGIFKI